MRAGAALVLSACLAAACGDGAATPTSPSSETPTDTRITFIGSLAPGDSRFYSFALSTATTVSVMLASVTSPTGSPVARALDVAVGVPAGTDCSPTTTQTVLPGLTSQLSVALQPGTYCVRVADTSGQTEPVTFALRFSHP